MLKVFVGKGTNWHAVLKHWLVWLQPYLSQSEAFPFNLSCMFNVAAAAAASVTGGDTVTWCNLATHVRVGTWTVRCTEWSNNTVDKGGVSSCKAHAIPTKIPGDFRSKEVVIFMGARFKLSHLEYVRGASAAPEPPRCSLCATFKL